MIQVTLSKRGLVGYVVGDFICANDEHMPTSKADFFCERHGLSDVDHHTLVSAFKYNRNMKENYEEMRNSPIPELRVMAAMHLFFPKNLDKDPDWRVRGMAVRKHKCVDKLLKSDPDWRVKRELLKIGKGYIRYSTDPDHRVRMEVARLSPVKSILVKDPHKDVRAMIAEMGFGLQELIHDPEPCVRAQVALKGYKADSLLNDPSEIVREAALWYFRIKKNEQKKKREEQRAQMEQIQPSFDFNQFQGSQTKPLAFSE